MVQHLLNFDENNSKIFSDCVISQPDTTLNLWATDPIASRILETVLTSESVHQKTKRKLVKLFSGKFSLLASDKYGSHFVDKCFANSTIQEKELICAELADKLSSLVGNFHAKFILRNCGVELFKRRKDQWLAHQTKGQVKDSKNMDEIDLLFNKK